MSTKIGILLLEKAEIIIRIYEANDREWRLLHYQSILDQTLLQANDLDADTIIENLAEFLIGEDARQINDWKVCARGLPSSTTRQISEAVGLNIEEMTRLREQELLCKGMFTELW